MKVEESDDGWGWRWVAENAQEREMFRRLHEWSARVQEDAARALFNDAFPTLEEPKPTMPYPEGHSWRDKKREMVTRSCDRCGEEFPVALDALHTTAKAYTTCVSCVARSFEADVAAGRKRPLRVWGPRR